MKTVLLENLTEETINILSPRLLDLEKEGHLEYMVIHANGEYDLSISFEEKTFVQMVVLLWAIHLNEQLDIASLEKYF